MQKRHPAGRRTRRPRTVALPKSIPKQYVKEHPSPSRKAGLCRTGEHNVSPREDFSLARRNIIVRHYPYFTCTVNVDSLAPARSVAARPAFRRGGTHSSRRFPNGSSVRHYPYFHLRFAICDLRKSLLFNGRLRFNNDGTIYFQISFELASVNCAPK
jgi:hypothetical protein